MSSFLDQYKRQPKLFIDLPSKGISYDESVIQDQQYTQLPVFGMNTMDEILIKTPAALFSGESTAQIIRSCIPIIKNPWDLVGFDMVFDRISYDLREPGPLFGQEPPKTANNHMAEAYTILFTRTFTGEGQQPERGATPSPRGAGRPAGHALHRPGQPPRRVRCGHTTQHRQSGADQARCCIEAK